MLGSSVRKTWISGSAGAERITCAGTSNTASRPSWRASRTIIWPACTTSPGSAPISVTTPLASACSSVKLTWSRANRDLSLGRLDLRAGGLPPLPGALVDGAGGEAALLELALALKLVLGLGGLTLGGHEIGFGRLERVLLVLRIETGDQLPGLHPVADIDVALEHAAGEAEGEPRLVLGGDPAGEHHRHAGRPLLDRDRAHGPDLGRPLLGLLAAGGERQQQRQDRPGERTGSGGSRRGRQSTGKRPHSDWARRPSRPADQAARGERAGHGRTLVEASAAIEDGRTLQFGARACSCRGNRLSSPPATRENAG